MRNRSTVPEFILLGLSVDTQVQGLLFVLFLVIYVLTLTGNLLLLLVVKVDRHLHTPMYFFLGHLSFLDLCHSSVTVPKLLENLLSVTKTISVEGCLAQVFFVFATGGTESCLLAVMAYDRYVAISSPLLYGRVMSRQLCAGLVCGSWSLAFLDAFINILVALTLDFCEAQDIHHFICELPSLYPLSCSDVSASFTTLLCSSFIHFFGNFLLIFLSYIRILLTILGMSSASGRSKAFSTCSSHLAAVSFFYGSGLLRYLMPNSGSTQELIFSLQYSVITPMLNPLIYSLKNTEVKAAMRRTVRKCLQGLK
ncbi:olfactory receptor 8S1-like [Apodemus sylvaticus]|uniref:olfactory receptor 8S1-like n=1 Tax=Apodemus sylvaticus TaxID=10129 RepID=UPI002244CA21|nr:olfactory receptor 8S1-like [Apodemus sylvaticus]